MSTQVIIVARPPEPWDYIEVEVIHPISGRTYAVAREARLELTLAQGEELRLRNKYGAVVVPPAAPR